MTPLLSYMLAIIKHQSYNAFKYIQGYFTGGRMEQLNDRID